MLQVRVIFWINLPSYPSEYTNLNNVANEIEKYNKTAQNSTKGKTNSLGARSLKIFFDYYFFLIMTSWWWYSQPESRFFLCYVNWSFLTVLINGGCMCNEFEVITIELNVIKIFQSAGKAFLIRYTIKRKMISYFSNTPF